MSFNDLTKNAKLAFEKAKLKGKQYSPEMLIAAGAVTGVMAVGIAIYQSITKTPEVISETKEALDDIHEVSKQMEENGTTENGQVYSNEDRKKDLAIVYTKAGVSLLKVYALPFILEALSITCFLASNNIIKKRNVALASAYAAIDRTFKDYRNRVIDEMGKEADERFRYNIKAKTIDKIEVTEDGEAVTKRETVNVAEINENDLYSAWFDEGCYHWDKDPVKALANLKMAEKYLNDTFNAKGYMTYNDVRDSLGLPRTREGQIVGWVKDPSDPYRANYISFGITDKVHREANSDFINGYEPYCILTFNCDGPILDYFDKK